MTTRPRRAPLGLLLCAVFFSTLRVEPALAQARSIEPVRDDVFRVVSGNYRSVYLVTDEGILGADPIDTETATWLKDELERRHDVPVRYVVFSHNHPDHEYGGEVFDEPGVTFVSHAYPREDFRMDAGSDAYARPHFRRRAGP